ncbi:MAG TPA: NADH-quinone oxidoreductase subunit A [Ignavibacteria bacterium]|nr:NADH-quinone oxidoreductase subunit A [Ignavibacteria bacterium]HRA99187.1 NADH-quinone oxidoreductase subunit A [Ignavibacteria bacterium]
MSNEILILFFIVGIVMVGSGMIISHIIAPSSKNSVKEETYECGIETTGTSKIQFKVGYYLFAILFLIFDVETIFMVPWAVVMKELGMVAFIEILIFLSIVILGLFYAYKKNALKWD